MVMDLEFAKLRGGGGVVMNAQSFVVACWGYVVILS